MISETRTIFFEQSDLVAAAAGYSEAALVAPLEGGELIEVVADPATVDRVILRYITQLGASERIIGYAQVRDMLIEHCAACKVPLPRRAQKHVAPNGDSIALVVQLSDKTGVAFANDMRKMQMLTRAPGDLAAV